MKLKGRDIAKKLFLKTMPIHNVFKRSHKRDFLYRYTRYQLSGLILKYFTLWFWVIHKLRLQQWGRGFMKCQSLLDKICEFYLVKVSTKRGNDGGGV